MTFACKTLPIALILVLSACGTAGMQRQDPHRITRAEIRAAGVYNNTYHLVRRLRPLWLKKRGLAISKEQDVIVYVDGMRYRSVEALRVIHPDNIASMAFLDAGEATTRYGTGHPRGVIEVRTRSSEHDCAT